MNIFITGASSGIGEYVAYEYSKRGATIALCDRRKEKLENIFTVVGKFIEPVVDTIQILINAVSGTDGKVSPELEEKQIKFRQNIETAKDNLLDAIKSKLGPFGGIIDALKPLIDNLTSKFGAKLRLQTAGATLTKNEAGEEGITTAEGNFVRADFSADQRRR